MSMEPEVDHSFRSTRRASGARRKGFRRWGCLLLLVGARPPAPDLEQAPELPPPSGPYAVGIATFRWTDSTRPEPMVSDSTARREVVVYLWYPTRSDAREPLASYIPGFRALQRAVGDSALIRLLGASYDAAAAGRLRVHAHADAPLASARTRYPLLVFSPGFGETALAYATVLDDLASHGYVVAAPEHPFDALGAMVSSNRVVPFASSERFVVAQSRHHLFAEQPD